MEGREDSCDKGKQKYAPNILDKKKCKQKYSPEIIPLNKL